MYLFQQYVEISSPYTELNADFFQNVETDYLTQPLAPRRPPSTTLDIVVHEQVEMCQLP